MSKKQQGMTREQSIDFVVWRMARKKDKQETIDMLCDKGDMDWEKAEVIYADAEKNYQGRVGLYELPWNLLVAGVLLLLGLYLVVINGELLLFDFGIVPPYYEQFRYTPYQLPYGSIYGGTDRIQFYLGLGLTAIGALRLLSSFLKLLR